MTVWRHVHVCCCRAWEWRDVATAGQGVKWLPPLVCFTLGYMAVEMTYLILSPARSQFMEFLGFHACIFAGLASFVLTDQGGLVALWGLLPHPFTWGRVNAFFFFFFPPAKHLRQQPCTSAQRHGALSVALSRILCSSPFKGVFPSSSSSLLRGDVVCWSPSPAKPLVVFVQ